MNQKEISDLIAIMSPKIAGEVSDQILRILTSRMDNIQKTECGTTHQDIVVEHTGILASLKTTSENQNAMLSRIDKKMDVIFDSIEKHTVLIHTQDKEITTLKTESSTTKGNIAIMISAAVLLAEIASFIYTKIESILHK